MWPASQRCGSHRSRSSHLGHLLIVPWTAGRLAGSSRWQASRCRRCRRPRARRHLPRVQRQRGARDPPAQRPILQRDHHPHRHVLHCRERRRKSRTGRTYRRRRRRLSSTCLRSGRRWPVASPWCRRRSRVRGRRALDRSARSPRHHSKGLRRCSRRHSPEHRRPGCSPHRRSPRHPHRRSPPQDWYRLVCNRRR